MCGEKMAPGEFEYESFERLKKRGYEPERITSQDLESRFPAWNAGKYRDGFYFGQGGFAESGKVVEKLAAEAREIGVEVLEGVAYARWTERESKVEGIEATGGRKLKADHVVLAAGAWMHLHHPALQGCLKAMGQPIFTSSRAIPHRLKDLAFQP